MAKPALFPASDCFLEGYFDKGGKRIRMVLNALPTRVGRSEGVGIHLPFPSVSSVHAEFFRDGEQLKIRDLQSTNGTFVNRERIHAPHAVRDGDVIHLGEHELRLVRREASVGGATMRVDLKRTNLPNLLVTGTRELKELIAKELVEPHFQPVVRLSDATWVGYEALARGTHPALSSVPPHLFEIAAESGLETELSILFRDRSGAIGKQLPHAADLYLNTHPSELAELDRMVDSLVRLRKLAPERALVLEIHEAAILGARQMERLRRSLEELDIRLAYDDYGAGQARLVELMETPPDILKFDIAIVRDLHLASSSKKQMVGSHVSMLVEQGITCLAEGVECLEEAELCRELGFELAQGYHFGRPQPIDLLLEQI